MTHANKKNLNGTCWRINDQRQPEMATLWAFKQYQIKPSPNLNAYQATNINKAHFNSLGTILQNTRESLVCSSDILCYGCIKSSPELRGPAIRTWKCTSGNAEQYTSPTPSCLMNTDSSARQPLDIAGYLMLRRFLHLSWIQPCCVLSSYSETPLRIVSCRNQ